MNKAQGCSAGWRERFPLAASIPCHPLGDIITFPTPGYSWLADGQTTAQRGQAPACCRRVNRSSGCQAQAGNQTWGCWGAPSPAPLQSRDSPECSGSFCAPVLPRTGPSGPCSQAKLWELQPVPLRSPGTPHPCSPQDLLPSGAVQLVCQPPAHPGCDVLRWWRARAPHVSCTPKIRLQGVRR